MAKVKVIKMNFTSKLKEAASKEPFLELILQTAGADLAKLPDEQEIWINTEYIAEIESEIPNELGSGAFTVTMADGKNYYIKNTCYDDLLRAWRTANDVKILEIGEYSVVQDGYAISEDDGKKIIVYPREKFEQ